MNSINLRRLVPALAIAGAIAIAAGTEAAAAEPSKQIRYFGDASSATGAALGSGRCDVNGDGYDDTIVGAWFWDKAPLNNIGAAYVLFGGDHVSGGDLNSPATAGAARIDGPGAANAFVGFAVSCLGDVNGDGIDDIAISHYVAEKAYVVLGDEHFGSVDLGLLGDRGFEVHGRNEPAYSFNVGFSMGPVGDVNDDGLDDFAVAGVVADYPAGRTNSGRVWVVAGKDDVADVDLIEPDPGEVIATIDGPQSEARLGQAAPAGDVNDDGIDDLVLGAYTATPHGGSVAVPGEAWVVFGGTSGYLDLADIGGRGFAIVGPTRQRDRLGISVAPAGDVDGDGHDDVIVGGDGVYNAATGQRPGSAWVVRGSSSNATVYTDAGGGGTAVFSCGGEGGAACGEEDRRSRGYWIKGADSDPGTASESTGYSLAGIGDVNDDGVPDFAIGAYGYDPVSPADPAARLANAGAVWVVHGKTDDATQDLEELTPSGGYRIDGLAAGDRFGRQVAAVGDVDGNGVADFAAGADFAQRPLPPGIPRTQAGEVMIALLGPLNSRTHLDSTATGELSAGERFDLTSGTETLAGGVAPVGSGAVTFAIDGKSIPGCAAVAVDSGGVARCDGVAIDRYGRYEATASFTGTDVAGGSASEPISHRIAEGSVTSIESSVSAVEVGKPVTLRSRVESADSGTTPLGGTVSFSDGGSALPGCGSVALVAGEATCETKFGEPGTAALRATYEGEELLGGSSSESLAIEVTATPNGVPGRIAMAATPTRVGGGGRFRLAELACGQAPCRMQVKVRKLRVGKRSFRVAVSAPRGIAPGARAAVRGRIGKPARKALRRRGSGRVSVALSLSSFDGTIRDGGPLRVVPRKR